MRIATDIGIQVIMSRWMGRGDNLFKDLMKAGGYLNQNRAIPADLVTVLEPEIEWVAGMGGMDISELHTYEVIKQVALYLWQNSPSEHETAINAIADADLKDGGGQ